MKAEHRKELQTNLLADRMGRLVQGIKAGPRSSSALVWVIGVLIAIALVGWYWAGYRNNRQSEQWVQLLDDPNAVARQDPGSLAGRTARFQQARLWLSQGLREFYFPEIHGQAVHNLDRAGKLYRQLLGECQGNAILEQEVLLAAGKIEETLSAEPVDRDHPDQKLGSLDRALAYYQRLATSYPDSYEAEQARKRIDELQDPTARARMEEFYAKLADFVKKSEPSPHPSLGVPPTPPAPATAGTP